MLSNGKARERCMLWILISVNTILYKVSVTIFASSHRKEIIGTKITSLEFFQMTRLDSVISFQTEAEYLELKSQKQSPKKYYICHSLDINPPSAAFLIFSSCLSRVFFHLSCCSLIFLFLLFPRYLIFLLKLRYNLDESGVRLNRQCSLHNIIHIFPLFRKGCRVLVGVRPLSGSLDSIVVALFSMCPVWTQLKGPTTEKNNVIRSEAGDFYTKYRRQNP